MSEDCARRLGVARGNVRFLAAHDSMLTEWLRWGNSEVDTSTQCLILIDVPYAREALVLSKLCSKDDQSLIVFTDEMLPLGQELHQHDLFTPELEPG